MRRFGPKNFQDVPDEVRIRGKQGNGQGIYSLPNMETDA